MITQDNPSVPCHAAILCGSMLSKALLCCLKTWALTRTQYAVLSVVCVRALVAEDVCSTTAERLDLTAIGGPAGNMVALATGGM